MRDFISGNELSDDEIIELDEHSVVQRADGSLWRTWRVDADGTPWLRSVDSIRAAAAAMEQFDFGDDPDPHNDDDFEDGDDE